MKKNFDSNIQSKGQRIIYFLTAELLKIQVFRDVAPFRACNLENDSNTIFRHVCVYQLTTRKHRRRLEYSCCLQLCEVGLCVCVAKLLPSAASWSLATVQIISQGRNQNFLLAETKARRADVLRQVLGQ